jgi:hypothetical protein
MSAPQSSSAGKPPWHLWVVGVLGFLWSSMGALDYVMTQTRNATYLAKFTTEQLAWFYGLPAWTIATWAIGVWGGVLGTLLLLLRKRAAGGVLLASVAGAILTFFQNYVLSNGMDVLGGLSGLAFSAVILLIAMGFYAYARGMRQRGVLT